MLRNKQSGSALLAFLLILVTSASYVLVKELNASVRRENSGTNTAKSLNEAKNAILGWSISNPVYPGILPMPDRGDGDNEYDGDSDCYTAGPIGNNLLLGKLPWKDVGSGCKDGGKLAGLQIYAGLVDNPSTATVNELWTDSAGKVFWYAASHNLVYETPAYPQISLALLETDTNWITVRDKNGCIISDRVAFVVIAPGTAILNQDRSSGAPAASNYLDSITTSGSYTCPDTTVIADGTTFSNSDTDQDFVSYKGFRTTIDASESYNDQLVFVTIDELMDALKKRVLNEAGNILSAYHNNYGALPWLTAFADPKANDKRLTGEHSGSNNQSNLTDSSSNFSQWGVAADDVVWNITDGSYGIVTAVSTNTLTISGGLSLGAENLFDTDDEYYVEVTSAATSFTGTAGAGSSALNLVDATKDFDVLDVRTGDILENITDGSSGVIETVSTTQLSVSSLSGGTNNTFTSADVYQLRTSIGRATSDSDANSLTLDDTSVDFTVMGIQLGDLVRNITDGSYGRVTAVTANRLTVAELNLGTNNTFSNNDYYVLPRFNGTTDTRRGMFSFHEAGEIFHTGFSIDWKAEAADGSTVASTQPTVDPKSQYADTSNGIKEWAERSDSDNSGTITVDETDGQCVWINSAIAECKGLYVDTVFLSGTATSESGDYFYDTSQDFDAAGVYEGDKVENLTNGTKGLVDSASSTGVHFANINGQTAFSITAGDRYRISIAAKRIEHTADANTDTSIYRVYDTALSSDITAQWCCVSSATAGSSGFVLVDTNVDFIALGMEVGKLVYNANIGTYGTITSVDSSTQLTVATLGGYPAISFSVGNFYQLVNATSSKITINDSVVENNSSDGVGLITNFGYNYSMNGLFFEYSPLNGGGEDNIDPGDSYRILYDFVDRREYEFKVRINSASSVNGGFNETTINNIRKRNVCLGYDTDCSGSGSDTTIPGDSITPMVTIRDYNSSDVLVGDARTIVPSAGSTGRVKAAGINFLQSENNGDIPDWFVDNNWHQYVYIAYSAGEQPGVGTACTAGADCLVLNIGTNVNNNVRALVMLSGEELSGQAWTAGSIGNYIDLAENTDADDIFEKQSASSLFNDNIRVAVSCPSDATKLCWSE